VLHTDHRASLETVDVVVVASQKFATIATRKVEREAKVAAIKSKNLLVAGIGKN